MRLGRLALGAVLSLSGCGEDPDDNDCFGRDVFGQNFDCGGRDFLGVGEACWAGVGGRASGYRVKDFTLTREAGLYCAPGTYCHPSRGCQPAIGEGDLCDGLPDEALWGMCADAAHGCYPADPEREGASAGPRVCRALPSTEGAFCDASVKPDCEAYLVPGVDDGAAFLGPTYAWAPTFSLSNPEWGGDGYTGKHLVSGIGIAENHYPAMRLSPLICQSGRCVPPPGPGAPCAELSPALTYPATGPLRFACAQPPEFFVRPGEAGAGFGAEFDFRHAVHCIDGVCTPASTLAPDTCFTAHGAAPPLDPAWCATPAEACADRSGSCLSPCRGDGRCGMCRVCVYEDGRRGAVPDEGACAPEGGEWVGRPDEAAMTALRDQLGRGPECGATYSFDLPVLGPVTGELWLEVGATGAFDDPDAAFDLFINGAFFERWHPDVPCAPLGGPYVPPVRVERRLEPAVLEGALDGQVRVELRATATACRCSQDDTLLIELQNRTRRYLGLMRDDDVCVRE